MYLFVYGTLKSGFPNNWRLHNSTLVRAFYELPKFALYEIPGKGDFFYPALVFTNDPKDIVVGEVYNVSSVGFAALDAFESGYSRDIIVNTPKENIYGYTMPLPYAKRYFKKFDTKADGKYLFTHEDMGVRVNENRRQG